MANQSAVKRPSRPTIDTVTDNVEPHTGGIDQAGLTNDPRPVLSGHGEIGSVIHIRVESFEVGTVEVGPDGTWTYQLPQPLSDGLCRLSVRASNSAVLSVPSQAYMIEVDVTPPPPPLIGHVSSDIPAALSGYAEPYSTVDVYEGKTLLGTATTGTDSRWTLSLQGDMAPGNHALTATARDPAGNLSPSSASFDYLVGPDQPTAHAVVNDTVLDSGMSHDDGLTRGSAIGPVVQNVSPSVSGHTGTQAQATVHDGNTSNDKVAASTDGTWERALPSGMPNATDAGGSTPKPVAFMFDLVGSTVSTRSAAVLCDGMNHAAGDGGAHVDHGAGDNTPKLTLADVLGCPGHPELFRADDGAQGVAKAGTSGGAQVPGMPDLALGSNEGWHGLHHAGQDVDLMVQSAMQSTLMA